MYFQAKHAKYLNFHVVKTTEAIPTKYCTVIMTTKHSLWVSQNILQKFKIAAIIKKG